MLKNDELKSLEKATVVLTLVKLYSLEDNDFYEKTKLTTKAIDTCINEVNHIIAKTIIQKKKYSDNANAWNKAHPEQHRKHNRESERRHSKDKKEYRKAYHKAYYLKRKALKGGE
jgi:hypothetical protein